MMPHRSWLQRPDTDDAPVHNARLGRVRGSRATAAGAIAAIVALVAWGCAYPPTVMIDAELGLVLGTYDSAFRTMWVSGMFALLVPMVAVSAAWTMFDWRRNGRLPKRRIGTGERLFAGALGGGAALLGSSFVGALGWPFTDLAIDPEAGLATFWTNPVNAARSLVAMVTVMAVIWIVAQLLMSIAAEEPVPGRV